MAVHPAYQCQCMTPVPLHLPRFGGEESGLCMSCTGIYDEQLYEMRLRQHEKAFNELGCQSVHDWLKATLPHYAELVS